MSRIYGTTKRTRSFPQRLANGTSFRCSLDDKKECVRSITMLMAYSDPVGKQRLMNRPITKLVLLVESELADKD